MMSDVYDRLVEGQGYSQVHLKIFGIVGKGKRILEVGSSHGYLTKVFRKADCTVDIVEQNMDAASDAAKFAQNSFTGSIEDDKVVHKVPNNEYQLIILSDVLEHLIDPKTVLVKLKKKLVRDGKFIISIPNIASWPARKELFFQGKFEYQESGLFDKTHLRFYSFNAFVKLLMECNLKVLDAYPCYSRLPFEHLIAKIPIVGLFFKKYLYSKIVSLFPNLSYFHYVVVAKTL